MKKTIKCFKIRIRMLFSYFKKLLLKKNFRIAFFYNYYSKKGIRKNFILYESFHGTVFGGNPYAIFKYLIENDDYNHLNHIITVKNINHPIVLRYKNHPRVKIVKTNSREYIKYLESCEFIINNTTFRPDYIKVKGQYYINTWHATLLKSLGAHTKRIWETRNLTRNFLNSDMIIMPNEYTKNILMDAYYLNDLYHGKLTDLGYPRNDFIFNSDKERILNIMHIPKNKKVILYAPTWRGEINKPLNILKEYIDYYKKIKSKINDEYVIYLKLHSMVYRYIKDEDRDFLVPFDIDTNELLSITDVLITDYSGIMFDYMITKKPILLFQFDIDYYIKDRGNFYISLDKLPAPIFYDIDSLVDAINNISKISKHYNKQYNQFCKSVVYEDKGQSCKILTDYVFKNINSPKIYNNVISTKKKILFFVSNLSDKKICNPLLNALNSIDYNKYTVTILFKKHNIEHEKQLLINKNVNLLYFEGDELYDLSEYININLFKKTGIINKKIYKSLVGFSFKNVQRFIRNLNFDIMINYCSKDVKFNTILGLGVNANQKILIANGNLNDIKSSKTAYSVSAGFYNKTYIYDRSNYSIFSNDKTEFIKLNKNAILKIININERKNT